MDFGKCVGRDFFARDALTVARSLVGMELVRKTDHGVMICAVTETEAYYGPDDRGSHACGNRRTPRTDIMFGKPGLVYVYLVYGMYHCLNFVTDTVDFPAAVLIRSVRPVSGIPLMRRCRGRSVRRERDLTNGPGKLCMSLGITRECNGLDVVENGRLYIRAGTEPAAVETGPRINIDYAGEYADRPWRFFEKNSPYLS